MSTATAQKVRIVGVRDRSDGTLYNGQFKHSDKAGEFFVTRGLITHGTKRVGPVLVPNRYDVSLSAFGENVSLLAAVEVGKDYLIDGEWDERRYQSEGGEWRTQLRCLISDVQEVTEAPQPGTVAPVRALDRQAV